MGRVFCIQYDPSPFHYLLTCSTCNMHILRLPHGTMLMYVAGLGAPIFRKLVVNVMTDDSERFRGTGMGMADLHCVGCLTKLGFKEVINASATECVADRHLQSACKWYLEVRPQKKLLHKIFFFSLL
ncbi:hypothetical protein FEM48_Zijuj02G0080700 [Ziziphus jujuba var. spinosa]|uniref:Protein yippee-like n=1 Tax=Ziziphus jujuba var. spinosa TaxID=714518 RepID=A0A978VUK6_ZIZJJ|nr:hypothetical protein FEM48_Zijuj02G0080700 [Ziziphus jujuba var. spinosa]